MSEGIHHNPRMPAQVPGADLSAAVATTSRVPRGLNGLTFVLWLVVGFSAVAWGLQLWPQPDAVPVVELASPPPTSTIDDVARALGASRVPAQSPALASRLQLIGVVADADGFGAALIAIDGQPPKPYRMGKPVLDGLVLQSVQARSAALGERIGGVTTLTLSLPARP